jgi:hypothetical protein
MVARHNMIRLITQGFLLAENIWVFVRLSLNSYAIFLISLACRGHGIIRHAVTNGLTWTRSMGERGVV